MIDFELKYFGEHEFKMGNEIVFDRMSKFFLRKLDKLRSKCGFPLNLNSSFRTKTYQIDLAKRRGQKPALNSMHLKGRAVDIKTDNLTGEQKVKLMNSAINMGLTVGVYKTFYHIDDRKDQTIFGNN